MPFDVINAHHKLIRRASINVGPMWGLIKQKTFQSNATVMNHTCLVRSAWKSSSKDQKDSFVSHHLCCLSCNKSQFLSFSGDGRWRQVIRRCASVADTGVTGVSMRMACIGRNVIALKIPAISQATLRRQWFSWRAHFYLCLSWNAFSHKFETYESH